MLFLSDVSFKQFQNETSGRVNYPSFINYEKINYGFVVGSFLSKRTMKKFREQLLICNFNFDPVPLDFRPNIDAFEQSYLIPINAPSDADEQCRDTLGEE